MKKRKKTAAVLLLIWSMILLSGCGGTVSSNNAEIQTSKESSESVADNLNQKTSESNTQISSSGSKSASESEAGSASKTEPSSESEPGSASKPKPSSESEAESASKSEPASEAEPGSVSKTEPSSESEAESASKPELSSESESTSKPDSSSESASNAPTTQDESATPANTKPTAPSEPTVPSEPEAPSINGVHLEMFSPVTQAERNTASSIIASITNDSMSEYQKVRAIHDYLVNHVAYSFNFNDRSVYTAQGAFNGSAVCQGYTDAFSLLCCYAGIQAEIVSGTADNGSGGGPQNHAWNLVRIDGIWYQVDVTWDDPVGAEVTSYDYFLITDARMGQNHFAEHYSHQYACTDDRYHTQHLVEVLNVRADYYYPGITKHYVTNKAEVNAALASEQPVPGTVFVIYWHNELVNEPITVHDIIAALSSMGCSCNISSMSVGSSNSTEEFVEVRIQ